jgi:hypothetical protein
VVFESIICKTNNVRVHTHTRVARVRV